MTAISWKAGSTDVWSDSAAWSTGTVPGSADDVTISVAPATAGVPYTVEIEAPVSVHSVTLNQAAATLQVAGTTLSVGTTFALTAGAIDLDGGTLMGGTYHSTTGSVLLDSYGSNFISGVTWDGTLNLDKGVSGSGAVGFSALTMHGAAGTGSGTMAIGAGVTAYDDDSGSTTLSNVAITLANGASLDDEAGTLTIASTASVAANGTATLASYYYGLTNQGKISALGTASALTISSTTSFTNTGTILANSGGTVVIESATGSNSGLLSVGGGSLLELDTASFTNTGSISDTGTLALDYTLSTAQLSAFSAPAGTIAIAGTLNNSGSTLTTGTSLYALQLDGGTINGGTIVNSGHFAFAAPESSYYNASVGVLVSVAFDGALNLTGSSQELTVLGSLTLAGSAGTGAGTLAVTGNGAGIDFETTQVLNNAIIKLGSASTTLSSAAAYLEAGSYGESTATTLVFGTTTTLTQAAANASLSTYQSTDSIINQGTITAAVSGGSLDLSALANAGTLNDTNEILFLNESAGVTLTNTGTLSLSGSLASISTNYYENSEDAVANSGLFSVGNGATLSLGTAQIGFTNTGTLSIAKAEATLYGSYTTATLGTVKATTGGTLGIAGTLTSSGTLSVGSTGTIATLALSGEIIGGTIKDSGAGLVASGGTLSGVTYDGTLSMPTAGETLTVMGGLTMAGTAGTGVGSISVTGSATQLIFAGSQTLNNVNVSLGDTTAGNYYPVYAEFVAGNYGESAATTLTLGATAHITQTGTYAALTSYYAGTDTILNQGTITASFLDGGFSAVGLVNDGSIVVSNGDELTGVSQNAGTIGVTGGILGLDGTLKNTGSFSISGTSSALRGDGATNAIANSGTITVSNGASLALGGPNLGFSNAGGTLLVSAATVSLSGSYTTASLGTVKVSGASTLSLLGTLTSTGTLSVGTGSNIPLLTLGYGGVISGGTIADAGGGINSIGGTLSGVTYKGTLNLNSASSSLTIAGGLTMQPASGSGAGTINLSGAAATLDLLGSQTISNAQIDMAGSTSGTVASPNFYISDASASAASTITLAASSSFLQTGSAYLEGSEVYSGNSFTPTGDTLINDGTMSLAGLNGFLDPEYLTLQNAGTLGVSNGEQLYINDGTLTNSGTISLSGSYSSLGFGTYDGNNDGFTNTGLVTIGATDFLMLDGTTNYFGAGILAWSNSGTINVAGGQLDAGGTFTTAQLGTVVVSNGGLVQFTSDAYLNNTGGTLTVGTGSAIGTIGLAGTIHGGIIVDEGSGLNFLGTYDEQTGSSTYGTLDAVTYRGALTLGAYETVNITGGLTLQGISGSGAGTILLNNTGSVLDFASTETLAGASLVVGASLGGNTLSAASISGASTLTLGLTLKTTQTGAAFTLGGSNGTIHNSGNLGFADAGGTLTLAGTLVNSGTLAVSNGETLVLAATSLQNTGVISVTNGLLAIGNATSAELSEITLVNSDLAITGDLTATGATLTVGTGTSIPTIKLVGEITGGTIHDSGNGVQFDSAYASLDNVTYQGTLDINRPLSALSVLGSFAATSLNGSAAGSLVLTGAGSVLAWGSTQSLNNATVSIGNAGLSYEGHAVSAPAIASYEGNIVTLGPQLVIQQTAAHADIGGTYYTGGSSIYTQEGTVQSAATVTAAVSGGDFTLQGQTFTSTGTIAISNTDTVTAAAAGTTNAGLITIAAGSALNLDLYNYFADSSLSDESFTNAGTITLAGGSLVELTDGGTFPGVNMLNAAGAHIKGYGSVAAPLLNNGVIEANGGTLALSQAVSGNGTLQVDAGAVLNLGSVSNGETATFSGTGGILGLSPPSFLGVIGAYGVGDTIDLASTAAKSASFSGDSIVVTLTAGGTLTLSTTSALTGTLTVTTGANNDSLVKYTSAAVTKPNPSPQPLPVTGPSSADFLVQPLVPNDGATYVLSAAVRPEVSDTAVHWVATLHG